VVTHGIEWNDRLGEDSHDGLFVIPGDAESLSTAIVRLCHDSELRLRLGGGRSGKDEALYLEPSCPPHGDGFLPCLGGEAGGFCERTGEGNS